jgi:exodeoxyribonuclease VII small subunit
LEAIAFKLSSNWTRRCISRIFFFVPSVPKNPGPNVPSKNGTVPFEEAMKKLETIVEAMESEELPLDALLSKYEEGTRLVKICQDKLAEAELKIQQLEKNAAGELKLKPLPLADET